MGAVNLDLSKSKKFVYFSYSLGMLGFLVGAGVTSLTSVPATLAAGAAGFFAGAVVAPMAAAALFVGVALTAVALKKGVPAAIKEVALLPAALTILGLSSLKAVIAPWRKGFRKDNKKSTPASSSPAPQASAFNGNSIQNGFNTGAVPPTNNTTPQKPQTPPPPAPGA